MLRKTNEINLDFGLIYDASPGCRSVGDPGAAMKNFYSTFHETFWIMGLVCYWLSPCYLIRPVLCLRRPAATAVSPDDKLFVTVIDILDYGESIFTIQISAI